MNTFFTPRMAEGELAKQRPRRSADFLHYYPGLILPDSSPPLSFTKFWNINILLNSSRRTEVQSGPGAILPCAGGVGKREGMEGKGVCVCVYEECLCVMCVRMCD